jgi:hypothetical protein
LICKSISCNHAIPHEIIGECDKEACCGVWPYNPDFKPRVCCIPVDQVKPIADCPKCGKKEAKGHHVEECLNTQLNQLRAENRELKIEICKGLAEVVDGDNKTLWIDLARARGYHDILE